MATLRFFGPAREAAGVDRASAGGTTVAEVLAAAADRYGPQLAAVVAASRVWVNGQPAAAGDAVGDSDEVAVLPPVSGG